MASRTEKLKAQLALEEAQDAFIAKKLAGQKKRDAAIAKAFAAAKTPEAYAAAVAKIAPAVSKKDKEEFHAIRSAYRTNYRGAPKGGGAAPATIEAGSQVHN